MSLLRPEVRAPYPSPPWRLSGELWLGLFRADRPVPPLPEKLRPVLGRTCLVVALTRYSGGSLRYSELAIGVLARRGARAGLFCEHIWVDTAASQSGGREIWGLPKSLGTFDWSDDGVRVGDEAGPIATIAFAAGRIALPLWLPSMAIGWRDGVWLHTMMSVRARLAPARMRVTDWSPRFDFAPAETPMLAVAARPMRLLAPEPVRVPGMTPLE